MRAALKEDKPLIIDILTGSFEKNVSVNYVIRQDKRRIKRIQGLMSYSFDLCRLFGDVFISDDNKACALIMYPDKRKTTLGSILLDIRLIFQSIGFNNITRTIKREKLIESRQPNIPMIYLWFIGVAPEMQGKGIGSKMLAEIIENSRSKGRPVCLETSTLRNIPWYQKFGFKIYHEADLGYKLYFLSNKSD